MEVLENIAYVTAALAGGFAVGTIANYYVTRFSTIGSLIKRGIQPEKAVEYCREELSEIDAGNIFSRLGNIGQRKAIDIFLRQNEQRIL